MSKNFFKEIKFLFLPVALLSILFLVIPDIAYALLPVKDWTAAAMDGLEEKYGPFAAFFIEIVIVYFVLVAALWIITSILDWAIWLNLDHLAVDGPMVTAGFDFISGIANMALILIFIYLAFAIILKIESVGAKKILPKLIIVALLLNFILVFIGMLIDITNIFYVTFLPPRESLAWDIVSPLLASAVTSIGVLFAGIIVHATTLMVPILNIGVMLTTIITAPIILIPVIINLFLQAFIFIILIGTFLLYIGLFIGRIVIIQILTILAPLAFICLILPQTKKYFDDWLKHFLSWLFVGLFLLFFLRLGFFLFGKLQEELGIVGIGGIPWIGNIGIFFSFYIFVLIYLGILAFMAKKAMPEFAQVALNQAKGLIKHATMGWAVTGGAAFKHGVMGKKTSEVGHGAEERGERVKAHAEEGIRSATGRFAGLKRAWYSLERGVGSTMIRGGRGMAERAEQTTTKEEKEEEGKCEDLTTDQRESHVRTGTTKEKIAAARVMAKKGELKKAIDEGRISKDEILKVYEMAKDKGIGLEEDIEIACPELIPEFAAKRSKGDEEIVQAVLGNTTAKQEIADTEKTHKATDQIDKQISATEDERENADKVAERWIKMKIKADEGQGMAIDENYFKTLCEDYSRQAQAALDNGDQRGALKYNSVAQAAKKGTATAKIKEAEDAEKGGKDPNKILNNEKARLLKQAEEAEKYGRDQDAAQHILAVKAIERHQKDKMQTKVAKALAKDPNKINWMNASKAMKDDGMEQKIMQICSPSILRRTSEADPKAAEKLMEGYQKKLRNFMGKELSQCTEAEIENGIKTFEKSFPSMTRYFQTSPAVGEFGFKDIFAESRAKRKELQQTREQAATAQQAAIQQTAARQEPSKRPAIVPPTATWNAGEQMWEEAGKFWDREGKEYRM